MTGSEFFDTVKEAIGKLEGFPDTGMSYLEFKNGDVLIFNDYLLEGLGVKEMALYLVALSVTCKKAYLVSSLFKNGIADRAIDDSKETNKYFSYYEFDFDNTPDLPVYHEDNNFDYAKVKCREQVFTYNKKTHNVVAAPALGDLHTDILKCSFTQDMLFIKYWKKYMERLEAGEIDAISAKNPFGENKLKEGIVPEGVMRKHFVQYFKKLNTLVEKQLTMIKRKIDNVPGFGTYNVEELRASLDEAVDNKNTIKDEFKKEDNNNDSVDKKSSGNKSQRDRMREKFQKFRKKED